VERLECNLSTLSGHKYPDTFVVADKGLPVQEEPVGRIPARLRHVEKTNKIFIKYKLCNILIGRDATWIIAWFETVAAPRDCWES